MEESSPEEKDSPEIVTMGRNGIRAEFDVSDEDNIKPVSTTVNVMGMNITIDLSEEAQEKRRKEKEIEKNNAWKDRENCNLSAYEKEFVGFYGQKHVSKNSLFCVVFSREDMNGKGTLILIDTSNSAILFRKRLNIIDDAFVNDSGLVAVSHFKRNLIGGVVIVFDKTGTKIYNSIRKVNCNVLALSRTGLLKIILYDKNHTQKTINIFEQ